MWDFSALSQLLETCAGDGLCGNPSHVVETATVNSKKSASRHSFDNSDNTSTDTSTKKGKSKIDNFHLDTKKEDVDINRKHYKRGRSYTPSQRSRNRGEVDDDDFKHRSYSASEREERDDYNRRRTRSSSLVEKKSRAQEKVASTSTKAPRRKNSDRDSTLPPLQPRNDAPKTDPPRSDPTIESLFQY